MIQVELEQGSRFVEASLKDFVFPGGEVQVVVTPEKTLAKKGAAIIRAELSSSEDVMKLFLVTDAVRRLGFSNVILEMPYVPYARQDRVANPGEAHALKVFANLINSQKYGEVVVLDPHSDVVEACFDNLKIVKNYSFVHDVLCHLSFSPISNKNSPFYLVAPDAGAMKKINGLASYLRDYYPNFKVSQGGKSRDTVTGKLTGFTIDKEDLEGLPCIIVDDICDGGGTFLGLASVLKEKNAGPLSLVVSHGIFSQGFDKLLEVFERVYCTNSFTKNLPKEMNDRIVVLGLI